MKRVWLTKALVLTGCALALAAAAPLGVESVDGSNSAAAARNSVEHEGQVFELANSSATANVETDEYVPRGEKLGEWKQMVTVQRLTLSAAVATDEFLRYFETRIAEDGASMEVLTRSRPASVFAVRFPQSERNDEQVMICLAFAETAKPSILNIVQYAIKPQTMPAKTVEGFIKSWRDKLLHQARVIETGAQQK